MTTPSFLTRFLPDNFQDGEEKRIAESILLVLGPGAVMLLILAFLQPVLTEGGFVLGLFYGAMALTLLIALALVSRGQTRLAGPVTVSFLWMILTVMAFLSEGVRGPTVLGYPVLVGAAAYYWNGRAALISAVLSTLAAFVMALMDVWGHLPEPLRPVTSLRAMGGIAIATLMAGIVMKVTSDTVRRSIQDAAASEKKFRDLIQGAPDGIAVLDDKLTVVEVNRRMISLFRSEREALLGRSGTTLIDGLSQLLSSTPGKALRARGRAGGGRTFPIQVSFNPVVSAGAHMTVVTVRDLSEEVRLEDERRQVEKRLLDAQKMEAVGQLAGGIAHDFNNILTVILGNVSLELERKDLPAGDRKRWEEVEGSAARAAELTDQLLAFSRRQVADPKPVELSSLLHEKGPVLQRILGEGARLLVSAKSSVWAEVDPGQMDHVFLALVQNARDAMGEKGTLRITCQGLSLVQPDPEHPGVPPGEYGQVCFRDTGTGMDEKALSRAFEPFFTTKGFGGGMGLGLATVHGVVTQGGGFVTARSTPGLGSTICLYFPQLPSPGEKPE